ncbi:MAG: APC family permease, partial [Chitinophagaceae bacterium]
MTQLQPKISLRSATILVVSVIIGSGVFKKIAPMSAELGSPGLVILCWIFAGLISLAGALTTAEMVSLFPNSGGEYAYFKELYGRFFAFLYGWSCVMVTKTAAISALAYIFAQSLNSLVPLPLLKAGNIDNLSIKMLASLLILFLSYLNVRGVAFAEQISKLFSLVMVGVMGIFIVSWFFSSAGSLTHLTTVASEMPHTFGTFLKSFFLASLGAFWGYEGWNNLAFVGEEIQHPQKNLPRALIRGTLFVIAIYVLLNIVYLYVLPIGQLIALHENSNQIAAVEVARVIMGPAGLYLIAGLILVTTLNATNTSILLSARMLFALSRDRLFIPAASSVHPRFNTPHVALYLQAIWAIVLVFSGTFDQLTDMLVFSAFIFYGCTAVSVIYLRIKEPDRARGFRVPAYPFVPIVFILFSIILLVITITSQPRAALW